MSQPPLLRPEEVASVLAGGAPVAPAVPSGPAAPVVFSLRRPLAIADADEPRARKRLEQIASALEGVLERELDAEIRLTVQGFRQEQVAIAVGTLPQPAWVFGFEDNGGGGIALALDPACALSFVELALGGAGNTSASGREPTPLESRVLNKLCAALARPLGERCAAEFVTSSFVTRELPPRVASPGETLGIGVIELGIAEQQCTGLLLATPQLLLRDPAKECERSAARVEGLLAPRLARVVVQARPVLVAGRIALAELSHLAPGTVVRLSPSQDAALELRVSGLRLFCGHIERKDERPHFRASWRRARRASKEEQR